MAALLRTAAAVALSAAAGCLALNPAYDLPGATGAGATGGATSTGPDGTVGTGGSSAPTTGTTGGEATSSAGATVAATSSGAPSSTGAPPLCGDEGEPCVDGACCGECLVCDGNSGLCVADDMVCGTCRKCQAGGCVDTPGGPCELPPGEGCEQFIYGPGQLGCLAYLPAPGVCDANLACTRFCKDPGEAIASCDLECADGALCGSGLPVAEFDAANYCTTDSTTASCKSDCYNSGQGSSIIHRACNMSGKCVMVAPDTSCGFYVCDGESDTCLTSCDSHDQCVLVGCVNSKCM